MFSLENHLEPWTLPLTAIELISMVMLMFSDAWRQQNPGMFYLRNICIILVGFLQIKANSELFSVPFSVTHEIDLHSLTWWMQSFVLPSRRQARRRRASVLVVCLILCSVTWTLSRFLAPSQTSTESFPRQAPARAVVFELFRHYRHLPALNETSPVLAGPVHRRRRGLLEHSWTTVLTEEEIFSEEEPAEQPFEGQTVESFESVEECPLFGGYRASDVDM